jgi:hypothetical protein
LAKVKLREEDQREFDKAKQLPVSHMRFRDIYDALTPVRPVSLMLREYPEDIGVTYRHEFNPKTLNYLTWKMLGGPDTKGLGVFAPAAVRLSPQVLEILFGDVAFLGDWIQGVNKGVFKAAFRPQLSVRPFYDLRANSKVHTSLDEIELDRYVVSGYVVFYARAYVKCPAGEWLQIEFGYFSHMDNFTSGSPKVTLGVYVQFYWKGNIEGEYWNV